LFAALYGNDSDSDVDTGMDQDIDAGSTGYGSGDEGEDPGVESKVSEGNGIVGGVHDSPHEPDPLPETLAAPSATPATTHPVQSLADCVESYVTSSAAVGITLQPPAAHGRAVRAAERTDWPPTGSVATWLWAPLIQYAVTGEPCVYCVLLDRHFPDIFPHVARAYSLDLYQRGVRRGMLDVDLDTLSSDDALLVLQPGYPTPGMGSPEQRRRLRNGRSIVRHLLHQETSTVPGIVFAAVQEIARVVGCASLAEVGGGGGDDAQESKKRQAGVAAGGDGKRSNPLRRL